MRAALARGRDDERGLTIVEGVVAALVLTLGALGVFQVFDTSIRNNFRAEQSQVVNNRLQAELEAIRQLPYAEIALTAHPGSSASTNDPRWRVQGASYAINRNGSDLKQMVINGEPIPGGEETVEGGAVDPGPEPFETGDISGEIYRFVTWTSDPNCEACGSGAMKRVIVAAKVDEAPISFARSFQEVHTDVVDPEITPDDNPAAPGEESDNSTASFWLTDTPCDQPQRQPITDHHPAHNTRGRCADGLQEGGTRGAPDLMFTQAPALCEGCSPQDQELFDYATDVQGSENGIGLTMPWASEDSCQMESVLGVLNARKLLEDGLDPLDAEPEVHDGLLDLATDDQNEHLRVHTWLSPEVGGEGGILTGIGTLELYTKTVNGQIHPGEICVWLFVRQTMEVPVEICPELEPCLPVTHHSLDVDVPVVNVGDIANPTHFRHSQNPWPSDWAKVSVPMEFIGIDSEGAPIPLVLSPGSHVGLAVMVNRSGTEPGQGLEHMYDAVGFESRLELQTETIIPFQ